MPCYSVVQKRGRRIGIDLPNGLATDQDIQSMLGARDHEDLHRILDGMSDSDVTDLIRRIREKAKRKRQEATEKYITAEAYR